MSKEKYKAANKLTAEKVAFPWKFHTGQDFEEMKTYIRFLRENLNNYDVVVPYANSLAESFPCVFPRSMRDFKHVLVLVKVSAFFHFAQRPIASDVYIMATREDFERVIGLWKEIQETTETSAPGHIIKFFKQVAVPLCQEKDEVTINDLMEEWNGHFEDKKSDYTIRRWVKFLSQIGYLTTSPDTNDKRRYLIKVLKKDEKTCNHVHFDFARIFTPDSFKEWVEEANQTCANNQISLKMTILEEQQSSVENIYKKYYYSEICGRTHISLTDYQPSSNDRSPEIGVLRKCTLLQNFRDFTHLLPLKTRPLGKCAGCGVQGRVDWQVDMPDSTWDVLCDKCGLELAELAEKD